MDSTDSPLPWLARPRPRPVPRERKRREAWRRIATCLPKPLNERCKLGIFVVHVYIYYIWIYLYTWSLVILFFSVVMAKPRKSQIFSSMITITRNDQKKWSHIVLRLRTSFLMVVLQFCNGCFAVFWRVFSNIRNDQKKQAIYGHIWQYMVLWKTPYPY